MKRRHFIFAVAALLALLLPAIGRAEGIHWNDVASSNIVLFYPGVTSWEFLTSDDHRLGSRDIKRVRKECKHCHLSREGDLDLKANDIAAGTIRMKRSHNAFEPEPIPGKAGIMHADIRAAYDSKYLYIRVEWSSKGGAWHQKKAPDSIPDRVSMQLNARDTHFKKYGCFINCHNDLYTMPNSPSKQEVARNPYYKKLGRDDVRLYTFYTRDTWNKRKPQKELDEKLKESGVTDLRSIVFEDRKAEPENGWIFDDRKWQDVKDDSFGAWTNGTYMAIFKVKLNSTDPYDVKLSDGDVVSVGFAIHDEGVKKRKHYVSFPYTIGLGADKADIKAVKFND